MSVVLLSPQWGIFETLFGATWGILSSPFTYVSLCSSAAPPSIWHRSSFPPFSLQGVTFSLDWDLRWLLL